MNPTLRFDFQWVIAAAALALGGSVFLGGQALSEPPKFETHFIERDAPIVEDAVMSVTLSDLDRDGDLDWTLGTIWPRNGRVRTLYWYEYQSPDVWVRHRIGEDPEMYGGACTLDANGDGWTDILATNLWLNPAGQGEWRFCRTGVGDGAHDMQRTDLDGDAHPDVVVYTQERGLLWIEMTEDPTAPWDSTLIAPVDFPGTKVHAMGSPGGAGDLDGDGDVDIAAVHGWFRNDGGAFTYVKHGLFPGPDAEAFPWGFAVKTAVADIDRDGDNDVVQSEGDTRMPAGIVWLENTDGKGSFALHWIRERIAEDYHSLSLLDYDCDGDLDFLTGTGPLSAGTERRAYLFENLLDRPRGTVSWQQHVIHEGMPIHEATSGDVDGDGDPDILLKPWNWKDNPKDFLYLRNSHLGGTTRK